ncbi:ABC transporter ATP-binding protein [Nocardioides baculatus]|uniref:ABC transporter ATP-binding protein n=1 Tax=Nocardioides baculatus TaxID=2801337 RepID=A0ABS1LBR2_9ACTN|nr:ABC transporter ATP-binding protein [Nocardioides baculatus]MBL0749133.1 ABC transporter ATP-binding protein [Nocardioides baculatus]
MRSLTGPSLRRLAGVLGFPPGTGALIDHPTRKRLVVSIGLSAFLAVLDMVGVLAMLPMMQYVTGQSLDSGAVGKVGDALGDPEPRVLVLSLALIIFGAFVAKDVAALLVKRWQLRFMAIQNINISTQMLRGYLTAPYWWHLSQTTGDKLWTVQGAVAMGYAGGLASAMGALTEVFTITFIFVSLLVISPTIALAAGLYFGIAAFVVQRMIRPRIQAAGERTRIASQAVSKSSLQSLTAVKEIRLRRAHQPFVDEFREKSTDGAEAEVRAQILTSLPSYFLEITFVLGIGVLAAVATTGESGQNGLVLLGLFVAAGTRVLPSSVRLISALSGVRYARAPLEHLVAVHDEMQVSAKEEEQRVVTDEVPTGDLTLAGVHYAYPGRPEVDVLDGVDLEIPSGTSLAVVGMSGAGKSTLVDVILGLQHPQRGEIRAGTVSVFDNLPAWQRQLAVVPQEVTLLDVSISENIAFNEPLDPTRLAHTIERAQLQDLIDDLPDGLETLAGERGMRLSGGQRQRVGIARALYRNPSLLVLDEATSALDNQTERRITDTMESLRGTVTVIVVAHRLSTVRHCDRLVFMESGKVASAGTFEDVRSENSTFARLVELGSLDAPASSAESPLRAGRGR